MKSIKVLWVIPGSSKDDSSMCFVKRQLNSLQKKHLEIDSFYVDGCKTIKELLKSIYILRLKQNKKQYDIIHAQYGTVTSFICLFCFHKNFIITFRGSDLNPSLGDNLVFNRLGRLMSHLSFHFCKHVIFVSNQLKSKLNTKNKETLVIPSGIDSNLFFPISKIEARHNLKIDCSKKVILFNEGNNPIGKNTEFVLQVYEKLSRSVENLQLIISKKQYNQLQMNWLYNASDVLIFASKHEGSPNVIKEALACNLPIVANDVGDVKERIQHVDGCYLTSLDIDLFTNNIKSIFKLNKRTNGEKYTKEISQELLNIKIQKFYLKICQKQ